MSNNKQSSIDWLENQLKERYSLMNSEPLFEQAKEMENSQKKEMYVKGLKNYDPTHLNEIYGGNNLEVTMSNNKDECCTPKGQVPRYVDCVGCDKKPIEGATLSYAEAQKDSFNIMENKQSSVDYFFEEVVKWEMKPWLYASDGLEGIREQAKAMHKEEIQDAYRISPNNELWSNSGIDYYNERFGGNNE